MQLKWKLITIIHGQQLSIYLGWHLTIKQPSEVTITASFRRVFVLFREAASVSAPMLMKAYIYSVSEFSG